MAEYPVGYAVLQTKDDSRERPILIDVWYPASEEAEETAIDYLPGSGIAALDGEPAGGKFPLVVMSHGAFGTARSYSWIAEHLARSGYVVAGVSHFGEPIVYGPQTMDPAYALRPWLRPQDCSFAVTFLTTQSKLKETVDSARIGALGHSSGGATALALGGALYDPAGMHKYCMSEDGRRDKGCDYARSGSASSPPEPPAEARKSCRDDRFRAIVALDPALGPGHDEAGLSSVEVPVHIVGSVQNDFLPFDHNAGRYARLMPNAALTRLNHGEGHFVFLNECETDISANGVPICRDRENVHRESVHEHLGKMILGFFDTHMRAPPGMPLGR
jgi:predicted dienelactone hydrolase